MNVEVNVRERVLKPVNQVFAAIINPEQMKHYFISGASGPMRVGSHVEWQFADVSAKVLVDVLEVEQNRKIAFEWAACGDKTRVTFDLTADDRNTTVVVVKEASFPLDEEGVKRALGQNAGWTDTLCCLKAYPQFGINLRAGLNKKLTDV